MQRNNKEIKKELFVTEMLKKPDEKLKTKYKFEEKMR